jgi:hypothetical protein
MKPGQSCGVVLKRGGKKLQGYDMTKLKILCAIDLAHAAAPQQRNDAISFDENFAGRESTAS